MTEITAGTAADMPSALAALADRHPKRSAIIAPGRPSLSFATLYDQLCYVRETLAQWGFRRGDAVAVILPKGPEMASAIATLPVGSTAVPIDPNLFAMDYAKLFNRLHAKAVILPHGGDHPARQAAKDAGLQQIELMTDPAWPAGRFELAAKNPSRLDHTRPDLGRDTAIILMTSGTTAERKLIPNTHAHIMESARSTHLWLDFQPDDLSLHLVAMYFSSGIKAALLAPLLNGTTIVCPPAYYPEGFFQWLEEFRPTWFRAGFTLHRDILKQVDRYRTLLAGTRLRFIVSGTGRLEPEEIDRLEDAFGVPVIVGLGSGEAAWVTGNRLAADRRRRDSVGLTIANDVRIRQADGHYLATGKEGEIVVRGRSVFDGYLHDPDANAEAFADGWFRTGDVGKFDEDGFLYLTGRIKDIINCGGVKISPVEIDVILGEHPDIVEGAAFSLPHKTLGEVVVAAVVPTCPETADERALKKFIAARVTGPKVPCKIYFIDSLPRTGNGKLQRQKLPDVVKTGDR